MPKIQALPTWLALNNCNFTSPTALTDPITGQIVAAGGLNLGDYTDWTSDEAGNASYTTNGILYGGRYRFVQVDSGATAANVKTGTIGYLRNGLVLKSVIITSAGSGQNNGTFTVAANVSSGGGSGAVISVTIVGGAITAASVLFAGYNYSSIPTFTIAQGGTPGTVVGQISTTPNIVTSFDQVGVTGIAVRPVVFLNSITPGNYGFIQELGTATVLGNATIGGGNSSGGFVNVASGGAGTVNTTAATGSPIGSTIGVAIDTPLASSLFKCQLAYAASVLQD